MMTVSFLEKPPSRTEVEHWEWEPDRDSVPDWNHPLSRVLGRPKEAATAQDWLDWVYEADQPKTRQAAESWIAARGDAPLLLSFRVRIPGDSPMGDEWMHVVVQGTVIDRHADGSVRRVVGAFVNTTRQVRAKEELRTVTEHLQLVISGISAGVWTWDLATNEEQWSPRFYELLGYKPGEIPATYEFFIENLLHSDDRPALESAVRDHLRQQTPYRLDVRMKTRSGTYRWFETAGQCSRDAHGEPIRMVGSIIDIDAKKTALLELEKREYMLREAETMGRIGGWEMDLINQRLHWSEQVCLIHEVATDYAPDLTTALDFFAPECRPHLAQAFEMGIREQRPYDLELRLVTARNRRIWVRTIGRPVVDAQGRVVAMRGVIQDVDQQKKREISLQRSLNLIRDQNNRLFNFAHIVSHNLRSHTGNLQLLVDLMRETTDETDWTELLDRVRDVSAQLNETLAHLNEVVTIRGDQTHERKKVRLSELLPPILHALADELNARPAAIRSDFSQVDEVDYVPAYLTSILTNLVSNAIRYQHPDRSLQLTLATRRERGRVVLDVRDNGLGIDLVQHGSKLFGLYKTFHEHPQARGFGLFLTRNYVEALGGRIEVASTPGQGTIFTVTL
jgi:PAS domain S-box-containing protein